MPELFAIAALLFLWLVLRLSRSLTPLSPGSYSCKVLRCYVDDSQRLITEFEIFDPRVRKRVRAGWVTMPREDSDV